ncbi:MAG: glycosyltransferase [Acidobacteriota bacterium]|nr:glycosyltransferase [Acidobacteriota bacterium]
MARIGIFCLPMGSHINHFLAIAEELSARDHDLIFFNLPENEQKIRAAGFGFVSIEPDTLPPGALGEMMRAMGALGPLAAMRLQGRFDELRYEAILRRGPALVREAKLDAMIVDQAEACSGSVAEITELPWVSVASGLCMNSEPLVPPFFTSWRYSESTFAVARNCLTYAGIRVATLSLRALINRRRTKWGLKRLATVDESFSPFAQICQQNREFDFPRRKLPECFHYVGPIRSKRTTAVEFPWHRLDSRPLIYASLGTLVNRHKHLFRLMAESCEGLNAQLVISLGGAGRVADYGDLPGSPLVVAFAPQRDLLARAALTITHAGLNTTLESLAAGVPLVAIPIAFEQPGIAARIQWTGTGDFVPLSKATTPRLRSCVKRVLTEASYRQAAGAMAEKIRATGGCQQAANIIEDVIRTRVKLPGSQPRSIIEVV